MTWCVVATAIVLISMIFLPSQQIKSYIVEYIYCSNGCWCLFYFAILGPAYSLMAYARWLILFCFYIAGHFHLNHFKNLRLQQIWACVISFLVAHRHTLILVCVYVLYFFFRSLSDVYLVFAHFICISINGWNEKKKGIWLKKQRKMSWTQENIVVMCNIGHEFSTTTSCVDRIKYIYI